MSNESSGLMSGEQEEHRDEHRRAQAGQAPLCPIPGGALVPDPRTDRRKYLVPDSQLPSVVDACRRGVPETRIARALGLNYRTWMRVRVEDERVAGALAEARKIEEDELVSLLMDKARGGELTAIIFALKGRHNYRDQGAPVMAADQRVNVTINLPAARSSVDEYVQAIAGEVVR